jgi:hypothetical protein
MLEQLNESSSGNCNYVNPIKRLVLAYVDGVRDRLCGLVATAPGYRSIGPGSIPGATRFSEKQWVWNGVHSAS